MEFVKVFVDKKNFYWTWRDLPFLPYAWLDEKDLKKLPTPFYLPEIHPDCPIGTPTKNKDEYTNIIELSKNFDELKLDNDLRKDLRRIEKKNNDLNLIFNEKDALKKSKKWFLELWKEDTKDFKRRMEIWEKKCYTISAYLGKELIAVHIAMKENDTVYYFGCWWNRKYSNRSVPIFLLKTDIENAIKKKMKYYDLEIGNEDYKKKWGVVEKPTKCYAILTDDLTEKISKI